MDERPKIKVCGITREKDAELALELGADYIGIIVFDRSPRSVIMERIPALLSVIPTGKRVMVDVNSDNEMLQHYRDLGFDAFQIHCLPEQDMGAVAGWAEITGESNLWIAPKVPPDAQFPQSFLGFANTVVYDAYAKDPLLYGGTGQLSDWNRFEEWRTLYAHKRWVLAGGLNSENITAALKATSPDLVDVNSGVESEPGIKDPERLRMFFGEFN